MPSSSPDGGIRTSVMTTPRALAIDDVEQPLAVVADRDDLDVRRAGEHLRIASRIRNESSATATRIAVHVSVAVVHRGPAFVR